MKTTAHFYGKIIDCRTLSVSGEFNGISEEQINKLANQYYYCISDRFSSECHIEWMIGKHRFRDIDKALAKHKLKNGCFVLLFEGDAKTDIVYDAASFRKNKRYLLCSDFPTVHHSCSVDYIDYYNEHLINKSGKDLKQSILQTFNEPRKKYLQNYLSHDIQGILVAIKENDGNTFHGSFSVTISCLSLGEELNSVAEYFAGALRELALQFCNVNARISVTPLSLDADNFHTVYFGRMPRDVPATPENSLKWSEAQYVYLLGVGWFNLASPNARALLLKSHYPVAENTIITEELENGALIARCSADISEIDVSDLKEMKALLYTALLPGGSVITLDALRKNPLWAPRSRWETIPVFEDELTVTDSEIIFQHTGRFNPDKIKINN